MLPARARCLAFLALPAVALAPLRADALSPARSLGSGALEAPRGDTPLREEVFAAYDAVPASRRAAWARFLDDASGPASALPAWHALWDGDTGAPVRIFGRGVPVSGATADGAIAESHARAFLAKHLELLAPGASLEDVGVGYNHLRHGVRSVGFTVRVRSDGRAVPMEGSHLALRYRNDRLVVIAAEVPEVVGLSAPRVVEASARSSASAFVRQRHGRAEVRSSELVALPLVRSGEPVVLRVAYRVRVDALAPPGRYDVFVDAETGALLASRQLLRFADATVRFDAPVRGPDGDRKAYPAPELSVLLDGAPATTSLDGALSLGAPASLALTPNGPRIAVVDFANAPAATTLPLAPGGSATWSLANDETGDAQLSAFVHTSIAKAHARAIDPEGLASWLDAKLTVNVNRPDMYGCNAFWDGDALNFLRESGPCANSARVSDVVYHEFGHGFHQHSAATGTLSLDAALGEGSADYYAASITNDPLLGPGFFASGAGLRQLDLGARWPDDIAQDPHETGLIWAGAMWDLRAALMGELGDAAGDALADVLFHRALGGATTIPTTYVEVLAADDDDGDLTNGTPHVCAINAAFARHGLGHVVNAAGLSFSHSGLGVLPPGDASYPVRVDATTLFPECQGAKVDAMTLRWQRSAALPGDVPLTPDDHGFSGAIPGAPALSSITYRITATVDGADFTLPDNPADQDYQAFVGEVEPLYCNDFEHDVDGWKLGKAGGSNDFEWGTPEGRGGDPAAAYSGAKAIGDRFGGDGFYKAGRKASATSPKISVAGKKNRRLQFRRWLTVQDGALDQANLLVNGELAWQNAATSADAGQLDHLDREWRFVDVDLEPFLQDDDATVELRFELVSDAHGQRGGWTIDDLCVVSVKDPPKPEPKPTTSPDAGADGGVAGEVAATADAPLLEVSGGCGCELARKDATGGALVAFVAASVALGARRRRTRR